MKTPKKTKNKNSRISEISKTIEDFDFEKMSDIKPKNGKSKLDIKKTKEEKKIQIVNIFKKVESERDFIKRVEVKCKQIKEDLENQLMEQEKFGEHFKHEIENYIFFVKMQETFKRDIQINGIRYREVNGNGIEVLKQNESYISLIKYEQQGLAILNTLELKTPAVSSGDDNDNDLY